MANGKTTMQVHIMPSFETMVSRMKTVMDVGGDCERFYSHFARKIANAQKNQGGVMMAWEMTRYDMEREPGAVTVVFNLMGFSYDDYMRSLFADNLPFAEACIEWHQRVVDEAQMASEANNEL